jgi:bis(5'-nucleosyl)-tetraphosphatase (symmetrical)
VQPVFVGDVQGCADELDELLGRLEARFGADFELWCVGDLVNRGPGNLRALRRVRELAEAGRARYVLGNHELGLLAGALGVEEPGPNDTYGDVLAAEGAAEWIEWLRRRPLAEAGQLGETPFVMVHAAVHPGWSLDETLARARAVESVLGGGDRAALRALLAEGGGSALADDLAVLTSCRSATRSGRCSSRYPSAPGEAGEERLAWHALWSERGHGYGVVYGHWALQGLHVARWLRGLDTGCIHHGRDHDGFLTAWLPDPQAAAPFAVPDAHFLQVRAHRRYYPGQKG